MCHENLRGGMGSKMLKKMIRHLWMAPNIILISMLRSIRETTGMWVKTFYQRHSDTLLPLKMLRHLRMAPIWEVSSVYRKSIREWLGWTGEQ